MSQPCSASARALDEAVSALKKAGHTVEEIAFPGDGWETYALYVAVAASEGNMRNFSEGLEGEDLIDEYKALYAAANLPNFLRPIVTRVIDERRAALVGSGRSGGLKAYELQQKMADVVAMRNKVRVCEERKTRQGARGKATKRRSAENTMSARFAHR